jgi:hypothetical protein
MWRATYVEAFSIRTDRHKNMHHFTYARHVPSSETLEMYIHTTCVAPDGEGKHAMR